MSRNSGDNKGDLKATDFPEISWGKVRPDEALGIVFHWATNQGISAVNYYLIKKKWDKRCGWIIRFLSAVLVAIAAILPTVSQLTTNNYGRTWLPPVYATLVAAVAGALFGLDRAMGWSNGWMRNIKTAGAIHTLLDDFVLEWTKMTSSLNSGSVSYDDLGLLIEKAREFVASIHVAIDTETEAWISDYKKANAEFTKLLEKGLESEYLQEDKSKLSRTATITDNDVHEEKAGNKDRVCMILKGKAVVTIGGGPGKDVEQGDSISIPPDTALKISKKSSGPLSYYLVDKE